MELFLPSLFILSLTAFVVFFILPRFSPYIVFILCSIFLVFASYAHFKVYSNEYKNLAIRLAKDEEYSKQIKDKLRHNILTTKLFDPVGNTKAIEKAYIEMVSRYHAEQNLEDIYINN